MRKLIAATVLAVGLVSLPTAAQAGATWRVRINASASQVVAGHRVFFSGIVNPKAGAVGQKVTLQEKFKPGKPWVDQRKATIGKGGKYSIADRPTTNFVHSYRVVLPATPQHAKGISPTLKVKVFGWTDLSTMGVANSQGVTYGTVDINGKPYGDSIYAYYGSTQYIEYNLNHKCTKFRARFGISDDSSTNGQAEVDALSDGTNIYTRTFDLGQSALKTLALAAPLKLRLEAHSTGDAGTFGYGAFATAQVLCIR